MNDLKSFIVTKKIALITLVISLVLALFVLYTPQIVGSDDTNQFSAVRAAAHIAEISKKPHSYYDQVELAEVRSYITNTLSNYLGVANVTEITYSTNEVETLIGESLPYPLVNVFGHLKGETDDGILLVAHYDSRGHIGRFGELGRSFGAMDDGYGVGSLLELAYVLKDLNPKNSVYFLFTDAEEVGLYGARVAALDNNVMDNAKFVINLESRGQHGPVYMFETSTNNHKVIDLYKHAKLPVTYSMATAVYSVMPNFTDFTPFVDEGLPGLNFANLAGIDSYHSPLDTYELISMTTIQHMGSQVEPIIREFISNSKYVGDNYFDAKADQVFFTLFANVLITYSQTFAYILMILLVVGFGVLLFFNIKDQTITKEVLTKSLPKSLILTATLLAASYLFSNIVAFIGKVPFSLFYVRVSGSDLPAVIFMLLVTLVLVLKIRKTNENNILVIGTSFNLILAILTTLFLPGASFLFSLATLFGIIVLVSNKVNNVYVKHLLLVVSYLVLLLLIIPLLYSFYMALTVGGMMILVLLLVIIGSIFISAIIKQFKMEGGKMNEQ